MAARKSALKAAASTPQDAAAGGPTPEPVIDIPTVEVLAEPEPAPVAPPHPVKRYQVAPSAHLGTRVGGCVLTERGWVRDTSEQEQ